MDKKERQRLDAILSGLKAAYPDAKPGLDFTNPFELLIATMLSAQCTDKQVNKVTPALFRDCPNPASMAALGEEGLIPYIRSCGFFATKAKHIIQACLILCEKYQGQVPQDRAALESLPGVGRKTANVVLANAFGVPAIAVDTHVFRVSNRLGLAQATTVEKTEKQLMERIPEQDWSDAHHWLIYHGRQICSARSPKCGLCPVAEHCKNLAGPTQKSVAK
ncbi:MAG: endonuclease III [Clostridia bacterium]|nr:endonuclease III [Clostridia bacterium]